jgi:hypothetical protein
VIVQGGRHNLANLAKPSSRLRKVQPTASAKSLQRRVLPTSIRHNAEQERRDLYISIEMSRFISSLVDLYLKPLRRYLRLGLAATDVAEESGYELLCNAEETKLIELFE